MDGREAVHGSSQPPGCRPRDDDLWWVMTGVERRDHFLDASAWDDFDRAVHPQTVECCRGFLSLCLESCDEPGWRRADRGRGCGW